MVAPGSFYKTGLMPGTYNMIAVMDNGREILLPDPVEVTIEPVTDLDMKMPGSIFADTLYADYLTNGEPTPLPNATIELVDFDIADDAEPVSIVTDENGNFSYGPLATGFYQWRVDIDDDGWYEVEENFTVGFDSENVTLAISVPTKRDVVITLGAGGSGIDLANRTITFTNAESTDLNQFVVTATSDENGVVHAEVNMGQWIISDETDESHVLWHEVEVTTDDIELNLSYTVSVWVNGTIWAIDGLNELLLDPQFNEPSDIPEEVREAATNVKVEARSGMIILESISDENGTFAFRMPENLVFHVTASSFAGISSNTLTAGMLITNASELTVTDLFLVESNIIQGTAWLRDSPMNGSGTAWGDGISGASGAEVIATDSNGLEWRDELDDAGTFLVHLSDGNWTMSVSNADMNVASVPINASNQSDQVILVANPANITLTMRVFLDTNDDGVWENGTAITPTFNISSVNEFGIDLQVLSLIHI